MISIIYSYRNREYERVKRSLDSLASQSGVELEAIFVDYGSDPEISEVIKPLVESYSFCKYVYNETRGLPWNSSHALNTGVPFAQSDRLFFADIDLIFSPGFFDAIKGLDLKGKHYYARPRDLPQHFYKWNLLESLDFQQFPITHESGRGMLYILKEYFLQIGGFDEFYLDWGIEDNDIFFRLNALGLKDEWIDYSRNPVFHQWHPSSMVFAIPKWFDEEVLYFSINKKRTKPKNATGKLLTSVQRPAYMAFLDKSFNKELLIDEGGGTMKRRGYYLEIMELLNTASTGDSILLKIELFPAKYSFLHKGFINWCSWVLKHFKSDFVLLPQQRGHPELFFDARRDIAWLVRKLSVFDKTIIDYYYEEKPDSIVYCLVKK